MCALCIMFYMFTLLVPPVTPTVEIIPTVSVINEKRQVSIDIVVNVSGVHCTRSVVLSLSSHAQIQY